MASLDLAAVRMIVVAGGAGFVGSHVVDDLLAHCPLARVRVLDNFTYAADFSNLDVALASGRVTLHEGDIGNLELVTEVLKGADLVVNAAGESHVERSFAAPERFTLTNALGVQVLAEAMARRGVPLMIQIGSADIYGAGGGRPVDEDAALRPDNPYAASKAAADMLIAGMRSAFGLDIRVLRPANIVGTRQNAEKLVPRFLELAAVGRPLTVHGDGLQRRGFVMIGDVCAALRRVAAHGAENGVYNVAGQDMLDVITVARMVLDAVPEPMAGLALVAGRPHEADRAPLDTRRLRALGWMPQGRLAGALPALAAWYGARVSPGWRRQVRPVPPLSPDLAPLARPAVRSLFRSLESH